MDPASVIKAILINAAYQGAAAVCGALDDDDGKPLPIDPLIQDVGLQKKGVLVYEVAKIQYNALLRAFHDRSGIWPVPKVPEQSPLNNGAINLPGVLAQGIGLLSKLPREIPIGSLGDLVDLITRFGGDLPKQPGQELKPASDQ